jgi:nucleotide-binding universal stress UspA family protein
MFGAPVTYVHVTRRPSGSGAEPGAEAEAAGFEVDTSEPSGNWRFLTGDDAGVAVGELADETVGALVCMSSHGRGWPSSSVIGSAAAVVLAATGRPLVLVGPACREDWRLGGRLTACVDGEVGTEAMLPTAAEWSTALRAQLTVVTVAEPAPEPLRPGHTPFHHGPTDPQAYLDRLSGGLGGTPDRVTGTVIWDPVGVTDGLEEWLGPDPVGLLVISSHGRRPRPESPLGHTARRIIHRSPVPVLVVPLLPDAAKP